MQLQLSTLSYRRRRQLNTGTLYVITAIALVVIAFPVYWLITTSVKTGTETAASPPVFIPTHLTFDNYQEVLTTEGIPRFFLNSVIVAVASTALTTFLGSLAAYALAKTYLAFRVRRIVMLWILVTRIFPPITTAIPYYVLIKNLHLIDTYPAIVLTYVSYGLPFVIWLMLGFFQDLPAEIEKAAIVDGCSMWQRFMLVVMPLSLPGLAVTAIFAFIYSWNEFLYASMLTSFHAKTLPVVIAGYISDKYLLWGQMSALGTMMIVPVMLFAAGAQKYLVRGLTFGAVKG
jgi:multiple sugar transport system permease protein